MSAPKSKPLGVRATLTTWMHGAISVAPNRWCEVSVAFDASQGHGTTFRIDPDAARELAARLLSAADDAETIFNRRVRPMPPKGGA